MTDRLQSLENLVDTLRGPDGCPWDRDQTVSDLRAFILEEAHELAAAIDSGDHSAIQEELGDLVFQLVFLSRLIDGDQSSISLDTALEAIRRKMVERHPHVFGSEKLADAEAVNRAWEERKVKQRGSTLGGVPATMPALAAAYRISQKAAGAGFDWPAVADVLAKIDEELAEVTQAIEERLGDEAAAEEVGDLLFVVANLARKLGFDPEASLAAANRKFRRRFEAMEEQLEPGTLMSACSEAELERMWEQAKSQSR